MISARWRAQGGLICGAGLLLAAMSIVLAGAFETPNTRLGQPGSLASTFRLPDSNGQMISLSAMRGSVVVLYFAPEPDSTIAATDIQRLSQLSTQYAAKRDVKFVSVFSGVEDWSATQSLVLKQLTEAAGPRCLVLSDPGFRISRRFQIDKTATFVVIDSAGIIRYRGGVDDPSPDAPLSATSFTSTIDLLLAERPIASISSPSMLSHIN